MEREGKAAGSRVAAAHVGCCMCCVLCYVVGFLCGGVTFSYHTISEAFVKANDACVEGDTYPEGIQCD
jgi:hypothetical protein